MTVRKARGQQRCWGNVETRVGIQSGTADLEEKEAHMMNAAYKTE